MVRLIRRKQSTDAILPLVDAAQCLWDSVFLFQVGRGSPVSFVSLALPPPELQSMGLCWTNPVPFPAGDC